MAVNVTILATTWPYPDVENHGMGGTEEVTRRHGEYFGQLRGKVPDPTVGHGSKMTGWPVGSGR
jgi:hypothetical protein